MIDPRAVLDPKAEVDEGVTIGPFAVIGPNVQIAKGTSVGPHCVIQGPTTIGRANKIFQFSSVGGDPQDMKYSGEATRLEIGDRNVIREYVTIHRGTAQDQGVTTIGSDNLFMAYTHIAHDCILGNHIIMSNAASLAGHVSVDDWAILGGFTLVHQFCRVGAHCFCGMGSAISKDVPPFVTVDGHPAVPRGINAEGLRRRNFDAEALKNIRWAYRVLYKKGLRLEEADAALNEMVASSPEVRLISDFLAKSERSIVR